MADGVIKPGGEPHLVSPYNNERSADQHQRAEDPGLGEGVNLADGRVTHPAVAESLHLP